MNIALIQQQSSITDVWVRVSVMVLNATFNNISEYLGCHFYWWRKPQYPEKTTEECHRHNHIMLSSLPRLSGIRTHNLSSDRH